MDKKKDKLLIVEDNDFYRDLFIRHLQSEGYQDISQAKDGQQAINSISSQDFDAVLLDVMIPKPDGYSVLEYLKSDEQLRNIPVVMISTNEEMDSVSKCIELGAEDYLPKPISPTLLRARLGACLEKKRLHDQEQIYLKQIETEKNQIDELLNTTLPASVSHELKEKGFVKPRRYENVAVLFCDVIRFTEYCKRLSPEEVVEHVTQLTECFEEIALNHNMEKIKTIGDEFMATANLLVASNEPVTTATACGLAMSASAPKLNAGWKVRVGIDYGPVVAGIIGQQKYQFDLWGDTVNTAARMTRYGKPEAVIMTKETSSWLNGEFRISPLGQVDVKGKGMIDIVACSRISQE